MANKLQIKRGTKSSLPTLSAGELGYCTDTHDVYVGTGSANKIVGGPNPTFESLTVDTNTIYVDKVNHRVGIGSTSPDSKIYVAVSAPPYQGSVICIRDAYATPLLDSFAGIKFSSSPGTDWIIGKATVGGSGSFQIRNHSGYTKFKILTDGQAVFSKLDTTDINSGLRIVSSIAPSHYNWMIGAQQNVSAALEITPSTAVGGTTFSTPTAVFTASGNVGIGTTTPRAKLHIGGGGNLLIDGTGTGIVALGHSIRSLNRAELLLHANGQDVVSEIQFGYDARTDTNVRWAISDRGKTGAQLVIYEGPSFSGAFTPRMTISSGGATSFAGTVTATAFSGPLTGNVTGNCSGSSGSCTGNAATATTLQTARTINGVSFNGSANITVYDSTKIANTLVSAQGDIIYASAANTPARLPKGTAGQVLTMNSGATAPEWQTPSGAPAESETNDGSKSSNFTIDWSSSKKHKVTLAAAGLTVTFTAPSGATSGLILKIIQDGTGSRTITTWPATVKWAGGAAPTLSTAANAVDIVSFYWDGTNNYWGACANAFA